MKLIQQRLLRGANMYSLSPCITAVLEDAAADRGHLVAELALQLQRASGHQVEFAHAEAVAGRPSQWRVVVQYTLEHVAQAALKAAVDLAAQPPSAGEAAAILAGEPATAALAALRAMAAEMALPPAMEALAADARRRGFPVLRASEHAGLLTVGWGSRQWRFLDGAGPDTRLLSNTIALDSQLTRSLLSEALLDTTADAGGDIVAVRDGVAQHAPASAAASARVLCELAAAKIGLANADCIVADGGRHGLQIAGISGHDDAVHAHAERVEQMRDDPRLGRIPVVAVTGTNGKTTTTLMIAHIARHAGLRTGHTTTTGVFLNGQRIAQGDCTGYWSHRALLTAPQLDYAVLETARGGILKRGLAYDRCSVGVLLNVSGDHLGLDGVNTVDDLARVKSLVVRTAATAVLNADDPLCVAMRPADTETIFFSMQADSPVLRTHLEQGGCGVWLEQETIMLGVDAGALAQPQPVIAVTDTPATVGGLARYNIANALAATAASHASGLSVSDIADGLASFVSDAASNPLRTNIFKVGDIRILLDYAHNAAAYTALGALTKGLGGNVLAVVSSPGDRRDDDLRHIGACCAAAFDRLFVYESASRGRAVGEAAAIIADGARAAGAQGVESFDCASEALQRAYRECQPGDVMMFSCGTTIATLIDALRSVDPVAAAEVEAQAGVQ